MADERQPLVERVEQQPAEPPRDDPPVQEGHASRKRWYLELGVLAVAVVLYVAAVTWSLFATFASEPQTLGFKYLTGNISAMYPTDITPANWVFAICALIYVWQGAWLLFASTFPLCRSKATRTISLLVYLPFSIACACNFAWVYLWANEIVAGALAVSIVFALSLILSVTFALRNIALDDDHEDDWSEKLNRWFTYVLVHNGLALFASWLCIAWLLNMSIVADKNNKLGGAITREDAGTVALSLLTAEIIVWFLLEQTVLEKYVRYIYTIYPVLIVFLVGVLVEHLKEGMEDSRNNIFALGVLVLVGVLQVARLVFAVIFYFVRKSQNRPAQ